ncbi:exported hypothetical protein [Cupriavidus taiwanensis]|nr:exported hypothetical protein [Cupriavidus taiwanensis]
MRNVVGPCPRLTTGSALAAAAPAAARSQRRRELWVGVMVVLRLGKSERQLSRRNRAGPTKIVADAYAAAIIRIPAPLPHPTP